MLQKMSTDFRNVTLFDLLIVLLDEPDDVYEAFLTYHFHFSF